MAVDVEIDLDLLKSEFPTGRPWAEDLGYPEELENVPDRAAT